MSWNNVQMVFGVIFVVSKVLSFATNLPEDLFRGEKIYTIDAVLSGEVESLKASKKPFILTLEDAIEMALENNLELLQVQKDLEQVASYYKGSIQDFYVPNLSTVVSVTGRHPFTTSQKTIDLAATSLGFTVDLVIPSISLSKTLFTGFSNLCSYRIAKENYLNAQNTYENKMREIIYETSIRYYYQFLKEEEVNVVIERLKQLEDQLEQAQINFNNGRVSDFDVSVAKSHFYSAQPSYYQAERDRIFSQEDFYRYLRYEPDPDQFLQLKGDLLLTTNIIFSEFDSELSMDFVLDNDTSISTLRTAYKNSKSQKGKENSVRMPKFDVQLAYTPSWGRDVAIGSFGEGAYNGAVSLTASLSIPLLEWIPGTGIASRVRAAKYAILESEYALLDAESIKVIEIKNVLLNIKELEQSVISLRATEEQARRAAEIARVQYQNGRISLIDLNLSQVEYVDAKKNLLFSIYNDLQIKLFLQKSIRSLDEFREEIKKLEQIGN